MQQLKVKIIIRTQLDLTCVIRITPYKMLSCTRGILSAITAAFSMTMNAEVFKDPF